MKKKAFAVIVLVSLVLLNSCGGGGSSSDDQKIITEELQKATTYLEAGDIASARATYTSIIGDASAIRVVKDATDPRNAEARFGRAFCDIMLLIEKAPFTAILAGFGQSAWSTSTVFGPTGILYRSTTEANPDVTMLPFNNVKDCWYSSTYSHQYRCVLTRVTSGYTAENIAASLNELMTYVDSIIVDLSIAIDTTTAAYTVPKSLYTGDADIPVNHSDMTQILAGMYMLKAASDFANSWTFNIDLGGLVNSNGDSIITKTALVDQLNAQFGLRSDNRISNARTNMEYAVTYTKAALEEILGGASGGILNLSTENQGIYTDLLGLVSSVNSSFSGAVALDQILPLVEVNLDHFFNNPADGSAISSDPFVLSGSNIQAVEAYWQQMINSASDYTLGTGIKIFSDATRAISRPYYQLFNTIMGHYFGKWKAGTGA